MAPIIRDPRGAAVLALAGAAARCARTPSIPATNSLAVRSTRVPPDTSSDTSVSSRVDRDEVAGTPVNQMIDSLS